MNAHPIRVVLADDQSLFRSAIRVIIDAQPDMAVVGEAASGLEAIDIALATQPDVVLMDIRMPEMDGVEATRQLLSGERSLPDPPKVLVLTTFNLDDRAATAIRHGASGFLLKDITPEMLIDAIRIVHSGNAVIAPQDLATLLDGGFRAEKPLPRGYDALSEKEREVFGLVGRGLSNTEISQSIYAAESTVKTHVGAILRKLGLRDRVQVVVVAHEHGLVSP